MQTTIYYNEEDSYLIRQVDAKSQRERKSRSSVILSILEEYFESEKRLGEILVDLGVLSHSELAKGLELQKTQFTDKLLGDILLEEDLVVKAIRQNVMEYVGVPVYEVQLLKAGTLPKTSSGKVQRQSCRTGFLNSRLKMWNEDNTNAR